MRISEIEKHESSCGKIICDNPLCKNVLKNQKYFEVVTVDGKLTVCNDVCEQMAKFNRIKTKKKPQDCLKFF
jgi:hypothetical protein